MGTKVRRRIKELTSCNPDGQPMCGTGAWGNCCLVQFQKYLVNLIWCLTPSNWRHFTPTALHGSYALLLATQLEHLNLAALRTPGEFWVLEEESLLLLKLGLWPSKHWRAETPALCSGEHDCAARGRYLCDLGWRRSWAPEMGIKLRSMTQVPYSFILWCAQTQLWQPRGGLQIPRSDLLWHPCSPQVPIHSSHTCSLKTHHINGYSCRHQSQPWMEHSAKYRQTCRQASF